MVFVHVLVLVVALRCGGDCSQMLLERSLCYDLKIGAGQNVFLGCS